VLHIESHNKRALLVELFGDPQMTRALVFTRTKRGADKVARHLEAAGIHVAAIHGNKSQSQREHALAAFRAAKIRALVATDIAARGIDVDQVSHVVNFELPDVPESYVHRIGRTARAGAAGIAISLCDAEERDLLRARAPHPQGDPGRGRRHDKTSSPSLSGRAPAASGRARGPSGRNGVTADRARSASARVSQPSAAGQNRGFRSLVAPRRVKAPGAPAGAVVLG
jgi:ATP-dependent RNA helicase RhlE